MGIFSWGMHPDAERQFSRCTEDYGTRLRQEAMVWLRQVAFEAAKGNELGGGFDTSTSPALELVTSEELRTSLFAPNLFQTQSFIHLLRDLFYAARHFKPPYEYWVTEKYFPDVASPRKIWSSMCLWKTARNYHQPRRQQRRRAFSLLSPLQDCPETAPASRNWRCGGPGGQLCLGAIFA